MKPIGQTFFVNEPPSPTGVAGVYITKIAVYFQSVSTTNGVEMQIRTTNNGSPTSESLPFASKKLYIGDVYNGNPAIRASIDASVPTIFEFDTPVFVQSNKSYAFVVAPMGGDPSYNIWTAVVGDQDATTQTPIYTNNDSGDLFLSSNDRDWTPIITEDIKYQIYIANFTSSSGSAYFTTPDEEWIIFNNPTAPFYPREQIVFSNGYYNISVLTVTGNTGTISIGDTVSQGTANGVIYNVGSGTLSIKSSTGAFNTGLLQDLTTGANTTVLTYSQNVITTTGSNTITVPDSSIFAYGQGIHVSPSDLSTIQVVSVTAIPSSTTIQVNNAITFTSSSARYGRLINDGLLTGFYSGSKTYPNTDNNYYGILDSSSSNSSVNFSGVSNVAMIGLTSGSSANFYKVFDPVYNSITPQLSSIAPANTDLVFSFQGLANNSSRDADASFIPLHNETILELTDIERIAMSRSNEYSLLPGGRSGTHSVTLKVNMDSANNKISPVVDTIRTNVVYTQNFVPQDYQLNGYYLTINATSSVLSKGDIITQTSYGNTAYGTVEYANNTYIRLVNVNGAFSPNAAFTDSTTANTGYVFNAEAFNEANNNGYYLASRYISKNIILAANQDSEDIQVYIGAYRPANTNVHLYARVQHSADNDPFSSKAWTKLAETSDNTLLSSRINSHDLVEITYGFNKSKMLYNANSVTNTSITTITCPSTIGLTNNSFIYLLSDAVTKNFNVRQVLYVTNSTSFVIDRAPSFNSTNAAIGIIPGIESTTSAFLYDQNYNIVRYCTIGDAVYDSYIQYAMKFIPVADSTALVPRVSDLRVINLQA
jgi:hypothetical protein